MHTVIVDTREKKNDHILRYFDKKNIPYVSRKLDVGDYALLGYETCVMIERKGSLDELAGNFTKGRERFAREFERGLAANTKMCLLVERCKGYEDIFAHKYRSRFNPHAYYASLMSWEEKYWQEIKFNNMRSEASGKYIYEKLVELNILDVD